jgi:hypothetical protein
MLTEASASIQNTTQLLCGLAEGVNEQKSGGLRPRPDEAGAPGPPAGDGAASGDKARLVGLRALVNHSLFGLAAPSSERSCRTGGGV